MEIPELNCCSTNFLATGSFSYRDTAGGMLRNVLLDQIEGRLRYYKAISFKPG